MLVPRLRACNPFFLLLLSVDFLSFFQLLPMIFKISRNTRIQEAQRLTSFRGRSWLSWGVAIHITRIIPYLLGRSSPSFCPFETCSRCAPMRNLNPWICAWFGPLSVKRVKRRKNGKQRAPRVSNSFVLRMCSSVYAISGSRGGT